MTTSNTHRERIGWIGTGVMGQSMAARLLDAGYTLTVSTRTRSRAEALIERGAAWADSPREVAEASDVLFSIVGYPHDVESVYLDAEQGVLAANTSGLSIVVDMTTSSPALAQTIATRGSSLGITSIDAPVSGGDIGARDGTLSIMMGSDDATAIDAIRPILSHMGKTITHLGPAGAGQHTKMVNQTLISTMMIGVCEGLLYAKKAGLDPMQVIEAVGSGAAGSWSINNLGPRIVKRNFDPGFYVEHFLKDLGIALAESRRMGLSMPGLALAEQLYQAVAAQGHGRLGTQSLMLALEQLSGVDSNSG